MGPSHRGVVRGHWPGGKTTRAANRQPFDSLGESPEGAALTAPRPQTSSPRSGRQDVSVAQATWSVVFVRQPKQSNRAKSELSRVARVALCWWLLNSPARCCFSNHETTCAPCRKNGLPRAKQRPAATPTWVTKHWHPNVWCSRPAPLGKNPPQAAHRQAFFCD